MNLQKFTEKSIEAIRNAERQANEASNQEISSLHLLSGMLTGGEGLIPELLVSMGVKTDLLAEELITEISRLPKVTGTDGRVYISRECEKILSEAEKGSGKMGDEFVSLEHIMLAMLDFSEGKTKELLKKYDIRKNEFMTQLKKVRGNRRVTNENPEATYNVLEKYGQDLVKLAREHKLDPVIGRDDEIRKIFRS